MKKCSVKLCSMRSMPVVLAICFIIAMTGSLRQALAGENGPIIIVRSIETNSPDIGRRFEDDIALASSRNRYEAASVLSLLTHKEREKIAQGGTNVYPEAIVAGFERLAAALTNGRDDAARPRLYVAYCKPIPPARGDGKVCQIQTFEIVLAWIDDAIDFDGLLFRLSGDEKNAFYSDMDLQRNHLYPEAGFNWSRPYKYLREVLLLSFLDEKPTEQGINSREAPSSELRQLVKRNLFLFFAPVFRQEDGRYCGLEVALHNAKGETSNWVPLLILDANNQVIPLDGEHVVKSPAATKAANESK